MVASTAPDGAGAGAELMDWAMRPAIWLLQAPWSSSTMCVATKVNPPQARRLAWVEGLRWVGQRLRGSADPCFIASAGVIDIHELRVETRRRYLEITARLASGFNSSEDGSEPAE